MLNAINPHAQSPDINVHNARYQPGKWSAIPNFSDTQYLFKVWGLARHKQTDDKSKQPENRTEDLNDEYFDESSQID